MPSDVFLKFADIEAEAVDGRVHRDFVALGREFGNLGDDFLKLMDDLSSAQGETFLKIADENLISHDLLKIDSEFSKIDTGFLKLDLDFIQFGDGITNFVENELKITPPESMADVFLKIHLEFDSANGEFQELATHFATVKIATPVDADTFLKIADDFLTIDDTLHNMGDDFIALGGTFLKIAGQSPIVDEV